MNILEDFKDKIEKLMKNDEYFLNSNIENIEICESINKEYPKYIYTSISVSKKEFNWTKIPYPDINNIQLINDKLDQYKLSNYKFLSADILYKLKYDSIERLWYIKYEYVDKKQNEKDTTNIDNITN